MEEEQRLELINLAIRRLIDEENNNKKSSDRSSVGDRDEPDDRTLLRNLLSQIESLKEEAESEEVESAVDTWKTKAKNSVREEIVDDECSSREEIVRELKKVKRQNLVTHCLLSVMIVVTVVWQLSEVSIILNIKDKINHPFRSLGSFLSGILKRPKTIVESTEKNSSKQDHDETAVLPHVELP
ncbi:uncharacterized protein LOC111022569 [Momordica charantia]|uniref:Uncharacterized protein LOC111022569 n=1 Tax=Momordica charantia TaxID=3673 RepID=A0A6J1DPA5_MOMCH|nr:uncharacterized protein LOC111022569 [Momordica charantia]